MSDSDEKVVYEISFDLESAPKGEPIQVPGLGTFENGKAYEVTKAEADAYRAFHVHQEPVYNDKDEMVGTEAVLGPTLLQAAKHMYGVEVSTVGDKQEEDTQAEENEAPAANTDTGESGDVPFNWTNGDEEVTQ